MDKNIKDQLIESFGTQTKMASFLGVTPATVSYWLTGSHYIPIKYAKVLAIQTAVSFYDLRPDIPRDH